MRKHDRAALELALQETLTEKDQGRVEQVRSMLRDRPWFEVARFAAAHRQCLALNLQPWELPPVWVGVGEDPAADRLWKRMRRAGVSKYHPSPIAACEAAERAQLADK
jgi:hypothetical protein